MRPPRPPLQTTPLVAGLAVGAAAYGARAALQAFSAWKAAGPRMRAFYKGEQPTGANNGWDDPVGAALVSAARRQPSRFAAAAAPPIGLLQSAVLQRVAAAC